MIYTLTLNPALDYTLRLDTLCLGETNRSTENYLRLGGKGLNVSAVLSALGEKTVAYAFAAGEIGELMREKAKSFAFPVRWLQASGESRINVKIKADEETEINAQGAKIEEGGLEKLQEELSALEAGDTLVLAGSVPTGTRRTVYAELMKRIKEGVRCVVDASGEALVAAIDCRPFLIKPNFAELEEIFGGKIEEESQATEYAKRLCERGVENVLVSMGGDGALLVTRSGEVYRTKAPKGKLVDAVGAGDSVVAGFLWAIENGKGIKEAFLTGVAAGSATAFSKELATKEEVEKLLGQIR